MSFDDVLVVVLELESIGRLFLIEKTFSVSVTNLIRETLHDVLLDANENSKRILILVSGAPYMIKPRKHCSP